MTLPCFGRIAWAAIPDSRGRGSKRRPVVIVSATDDITATDVVKAVAVTTKPDMGPAESQTELEFDPAGAGPTGLRERCWAVSTWLVELRVDDIEKYAGLVAPTTMVEIVDKIRGGS